MKIKMLNIMNGVYWVEIPDIDMRILCGTPADSVKHLIKKGLIMNTQKNGISYETGPNAVLLSDKMVQNSLFSNLTEFPVLQMLYKQGMIIPNHPNNDGVKPLLIGDKKQVDIQMEYIFTGNYGLSSIDELIQAGADEDLARKIMKMKLKFAFGNMKNSHDLLDSVNVEENCKTKIKDELYITRVSQNIFEFEYQDEKVTIDLNLKENEIYPSPYRLGYTKIKREYFSIIHIGEGDGWDIYKPSMGSILTFQGKIYLIDAGPNILETLQALGIGTNEIEGLFHTHAHDDHFAGITSLLQCDHKLKYYSSSIVRASVLKKLAILLEMEPEQLGDFFEFIDLELDVWNFLDGLEVKPSLSPHPIETNIFYFRTMADDRYKIYAHLADISSFNVLDNMVTNDKEEFGISKEYCDEVKELYLKYADIKKIDIGGGMIHGESKDFVDDKSGKLLLSHTSLEFSKEDKHIGSGASFGTIDILIQSTQNYDYKHASVYLVDHFPNASKSAIEMLLNNEIITFNPNSIILREDEIVKNIYMIITGNIESIYTNENIHNILSSGTIIGELQGMQESVSEVTYRTFGYVNALKIPLNQYMNFIKCNDLYSHIEQLQEKLYFLNKTELFGEFISSKKLEEIANNMKLFKVATIDDILLKQKKIYIIESGNVQMYKNGELYKTLGEGDYLNSTMMLFGKKSQSVYKFEEKMVYIYSIDIGIFRDIPIVFWKLYQEIHSRGYGKFIEEDIQ
ncbi:MAG: MBL fold metallo-hydrolase [Arcobacteraceae bacterium]|nr:MBL fold metallo-hydrolase [Arcobacteraceae bacterium]